MDTELERPRWRFTGNYRLHPRFQAGIEFNAVVAEVSPLATAFLLTETERRPAVFLGTSSDRIGSPEGMQAYYATTSKSFHALHGSVNATLNYSEWDDRINFPFGAAVEIGGGLLARYMYDGNRSHLLMDYYFGPVGVSAMYVWLEQFGVAFHGGF